MPQVHNIRLLKNVSIEELAGLKLTSANPLLSIEDIRVRLTNLSKGITLANNDAYASDVVVNTSEGLVGSKVRLKGMDEFKVYTFEGYGIPIEAIYTIDVSK
jgi:hypothetical protein